MKKLLLLASCLLLLSSCTENSAGPEIEYQHDRSNQKMSVKIVTYKNSDELNAAHRKFQKDNDLPVDNYIREGWSGWNLSSPYYCEVHIVAPKRIDDEDTLTLGHEMAHCLYGTYHSEK